MGNARTTDIDLLSINTLRNLSMDVVQKANSGHRRTPMALASVAPSLWQKHLRFHPRNLTWPNRDRFMLSAGYSSMLLYSLSRLTNLQQVDNQYNCSGQASVSFDDVKALRQLDRKSPGSVISGAHDLRGEATISGVHVIGMHNFGVWERIKALFGNRVSHQMLRQRALLQR